MSDLSTTSNGHTQRDAWYLLSGFVFGVLIGLLIAGIYAPFQLQDISPMQLPPQDKDQYRLMIARVYDGDNNLTRAQSRLSLLGDENPVQVLNKQAQQMLAKGANEADITAIAELASGITP